MKKLYLPRFDLMACAVFCVLAITPFFNHNYLSLVVVAGTITLMIMFLTAGIKSGFRLDMEEFSIGALVLFWCMIEICYRYFGISSASWGNYYVRLGFFAPMLMGLSYIKNRNCGLDTIISVTIIISVLDNIRLSIMYPNLLANITSDTDNTYRGMLNLGAGNFGYCVLLFQFILFYLVCNDKVSKVMKNAYIVIIVCSYIYLFMLSSATLFFFLVVFDGYIYIRYPLEKNNKISFVRLTRVLVIMGLSFGIFLFKDMIIDALGLKLSSRLNAIIYGTNRDFYFSRPKLMMVSIHSWVSDLRSFFVGGGLHLNSSDLYYFAGQHSAIIDQLAYYGLMGLIIPGVILYKYYIYIRNFISPENYPILNLLCIICILNNILNTNVRIEAGIMMYMYIPLSLVEKSSHDTTYSQNN